MFELYAILCYRMEVVAHLSLFIGGGFGAIVMGCDEIFVSSAFPTYILLYISILCLTSILIRRKLMLTLE